MVKLIMELLIPKMTLEHRMKAPKFLPNSIFGDFLEALTLLLFKCFNVVKTKQSLEFFLMQSVLMLNEPINKQMNVHHSADYRNFRITFC